MQRATYFLMQWQNWRRFDKGGRSGRSRQHQNRISFLSMLLPFLLVFLPLVFSSKAKNKPYENEDPHHQEKGYLFLVWQQRYIWGIARPPAVPRCFNKAARRFELFFPPFSYTCKMDIQVQGKEGWKSSFTWINKALSIHICASLELTCEPFLENAWINFSTFVGVLTVAIRLKKKNEWAKRIYTYIDLSKMLIIMN